MAETMPDVTLARYNGQIWLVGGEEHADALLIGALPSHVTVGLVECENRAMINTLWLERSSESTEGTQPWILNPLLTRRLLATLEPTPALVQFTPWSAMLDAAAQEAMETAAAWLHENQAGTLVLRQFAAATPMPGQVDLQRLRGQLVVAALLRANADPSRISEDIALADTVEAAERLVIVTELPVA